jgi:hypothetical protein
MQVDLCRSQQLSQAARAKGCGSPGIRPIVLRAGSAQRARAGRAAGHLLQ